jgi:hypothetical protein
MKTLLEWIAINAFPEILKQKPEGNGQTVMYFGKENLVLRCESLQKRVKVILILVSLLLISNILQLFGAFLLIETSNMHYVETKEFDCFLIDNKNQNPVSCADLNKMNGTNAVVCYKIVFNLPVAVGLSYGIFKTCATALAVTTILMMRLSHQKIPWVKTSVFLISFSLVRSFNSYAVSWTIAWS